MNSKSSMFFNDIDTSRFRKDIDPDRAIELVYFALEGVGNKYLKKYKGADLESMLSDTDKILKEYEEYIDILKHGVYENTAE